MCVVDESVFNIPKQYKSIGADTIRPYTTAVDDDDILLQLAIQQSLSSSDGANEQDEEQVCLVD